MTILPVVSCPDKFLRLIGLTEARCVSAIANYLFKIAMLGLEYCIWDRLIERDNEIMKFGKWEIFADV